MLLLAAACTSGSTSASSSRDDPAASARSERLLAVVLDSGQIAISRPGVTATVDRDPDGCIIIRVGEETKHTCAPPDTSGPVTVLASATFDDLNLTTFAIEMPAGQPITIGNGPGTSRGLFSNASNSVGLAVVTDAKWISVRTDDDVVSESICGLTPTKPAGTGTCDPDGYPTE